MAFSGLGSGTIGDPYQITTVAQFYEMSGDANAGLYYLLMNSLNLAENATIISLYAHFDGGNHTITSPLPLVYGEDKHLWFSAQSNHIQAYWVSTDGGGTITNYGYQRGTTYGIYEPMIWVGMYLDNPFWWYQDFIVGVTYYLRMGAVNEAGVGYGDIYTFVKTS